MNDIENELRVCEKGIQVFGVSLLAAEEIQIQMTNWLDELGIGSRVQTGIENRGENWLVEFRLQKQYADEIAPDGDTSQICSKLNLDTISNTADLEREIGLCLLLCPVPFQFPSFAELMSSIRIRKTIVNAARKTALAFATQEAERPAEYWSYDEDRGFVLNPGKSLVTALQKATQPEVSGKKYTFSCRRAAEYIVLLGITVEAMESNPELQKNLHRQAETRALKGAEFESIFLRRIGSPTNPVPLRFFVPGDRTWFRNPDPVSSDVTGYEGSWTFHLSGGLFADFWRVDQIYNLSTKCLAIYHWRNSTFRDHDGNLQMDEDRVESQVQSTLADPEATERVLREMIQLQEPLTVFWGGCIEPHREYPRNVCRGTTDIQLPDLA